MLDIKERKYILRRFSSQRSTFYKNVTFESLTSALQASRKSIYVNSCSFQKYDKWHYYLHMTNSPGLRFEKDDFSGKEIKQSVP